MQLLSALLILTSSVYLEQARHDRISFGRYQYFLHIFRTHILYWDRMYNAKLSIDQLIQILNLNPLIF